MRCGAAKHSEFGNAQHSVAWQNSTARQQNSAQRIQCGKCLWAKQSVATRQIQHGDNGAVFGRGTSLSLSRCSHLWHAFALNLKGFFTHFVVVSSRFILDFTLFIAISSYLVVNFSYFIAVLSRIFAYKRHFLGHCAFLKFLNALFLGFLRLSLRAIFTRKAHFVILSLCKKAKNPHKLKENLPFLDTSLALSMTKFMTQRVFGMARQIGMINLGCRLNLIVCHALILSKFAMTEKWQVLVWNL